MTAFAYGSTWKYQVVATGAGAGFQAPSFDDSAWPVGAAPFGDGTSCPVSAAYPPATLWSRLAPGRDLLLRRSMTPGTYRLAVAADDTADIWLGGVLVHADAGLFRPTPCAQRDDTVINLVVSGSAILAVRAKDIGTGSSPGNQTYFDAEALLVQAGVGWGIGGVPIA